MPVLLVKFEDLGGGLGSDPKRFRGEGPSGLSGRAQFLSCLSRFFLQCPGYRHPGRAVCSPWRWAAPAQACRLALGGEGLVGAHARAPFLARLSSLWDALGGSPSLEAG